MNVVLVNNTSYMEESSYSLPLGLLSIAATIEDIVSQIIVLNLPRFEYQNGNSGVQQDIEFASAIMKYDPSIVGFSTLCDSYPKSINLAKICKSINPGITIIFGGPQATIADKATLEHFTFIDMIIRGEAESTFPEVIRRLLKRQSISDVPGLTYREGETIKQNPSPPLIDDMDSLPIPLYHLIPDISLRKAIPIEVGRGCPFRCKFCSTNAFFKRRFRLKSVNRIIQEIQILIDAYGIRQFNLVHDVFTIDERKVREFCETLLEKDFQIQWTCSSRTDCVNQELLSLMDKAGCVGIYYGIETGSPRLQKVIYKNLNLQKSRAIIQASLSQGIAVTSSFITGFPEETLADLNMTLTMMLDTFYAGEKTEVQLHLLSPLLETQVYRENSRVLAYDGFFSDISDGPPLSDKDIALIRKLPEVFASFYYVPTPYLDRNMLKGLYTFFIFLRRFKMSVFLLGNLLGKRFIESLCDRATILKDRNQMECFEVIPHLLLDIIQTNNFGGSYLEDVVCFETILQALQNKSAKSSLQITQSATFSCDVLALIAEIKQSDFKVSTPPKPKPEKTILYFHGNNGKISVEKVSSIFHRSGEKVKEIS